jgi:hypothetical protein
MVGYYTEQLFVGKCFECGIIPLTLEDSDSQPGRLVELSIRNPTRAKSWISPIDRTGALAGYRVMTSFIVIFLF